MFFWGLFNLAFCFISEAEFCEEVRFSSRQWEGFWWMRTCKSLHFLSCQCWDASGIGDLFCDQATSQGCVFLTASVYCHTCSDQHARVTVKYTPLQASGGKGRLSHLCVGRDLPLVCSAISAGPWDSVKVTELHVKKNSCFNDLLHLIHLFVDWYVVVDPLVVVVHSHSQSLFGWLLSNNVVV